MRRKIDLYIGGVRADLDDQDLILMTWTQEDATDPTAVIAPYSQQVTLPGTPTNNRIFGGMWRPDRLTAAGGTWTGADFDPLRKTPFAIYADTGEIIESGYVRLDSVPRNGRAVQYKVTLFGSIGGFFRALSVNADGSAMTLADLDYTSAGGPDELNFEITASAVRSAWQDLSQDEVERWQIINFAPAYEGAPDGDFDPSLAVVDPSVVPGCPAPVDGYDTKDGLALVKLDGPVTGWEAKDMRSYLQRPVINVGKVIDAIVRKAEDAGYTFDFSAMADLGMLNPRNMWLTLPQLSSLAPNSLPDARLVKSASMTAGSPVATWAVNPGQSIQSGTLVTVSVGSSFVAYVSSTTPTPMKRLSWQVGAESFEATSMYFVRFVGLAGGQQVAASKIICMGNSFGLYGLTPRQAYVLLSGVDVFGDDQFVTGEWGGVSVIDATSVRMTAYASATLQGYDIDTVQLQVIIAGVLTRWVRPRGDEDGSMESGYMRSAASIRPVLITGIGAYGPTTMTANAVLSIAGSVTDTVSFSTTAKTIRSGALITKRMLLATTGTPASYLLSLAKTLGLYFAVDPATNSVTLLTRGGFYNGPTEDLTRRIDPTTVELLPLAVDSKYYRMAADVKGAFADEYAKTYGAPYGSQRINTGYEFNDTVKDLIAGNVLRSAVTALEKSRYFIEAQDTNGDYIPPQFTDSGTKYVLWSAAGEEKEFDISGIVWEDVSITQMNADAALAGYDIAEKIQLHSADGKAVDGANILLYYGGDATYPYFKVSDDTSAMMDATGGKGCWDLTPGDYAGIDIPVFRRYYVSTGGVVQHTLDYGEPREMAVPAQYYQFGSGVSIYYRCWRNYLRDRFDGDTKVMRCKADLGGLRVDAGLLRRFWWYEGALWTLNKISNHSLTAWALTDCEFVQVQDIDDYVNGQYF